VAGCEGQGRLARPGLSLLGQASVWPPALTDQSHSPLPLLPPPMPPASCRRRRAALAHMHPLGLTDDWADKLQGESFSDEAAGITYEHYMQVLQLYCSSSELYCFPAPAWHTWHALLHVGRPMHGMHASHAVPLIITSPALCPALPAGCADHHRAAQPAGAAV
jgi:hypothetical protein